jgi:hypothetical protein
VVKLLTEKDAFKGIGKFPGAMWQIIHLFLYLSSAHHEICFEFDILKIDKTSHILFLCPFPP